MGIDQRGACFLLLFLLAQGWGCAPTLPSTKDQVLQLPQEFVGLASNAQSTASKSWQTFFPDKTLHYLIETALGNNQEMHILEQEILIASNEIRARQGEYLPRVGLQAGLGLEKVGESTSQGKSDSSSGVDNPLGLGKLGLVSTWEVDVWSKLRNATKAAYFSYLSSVEVRKFLTTHLVAELAHIYFDLLALDNQMAVINAYVAILQEIKTMVEYQQVAARATSLAVKRFAAEIAKNKARQYNLQQQIVVAENTLHTLLGQFPQAFTRDANTFLSLAFEPIEAGMPTTLLDNRPDIKTAIFELEAAKLSVDSVKARFFPALSIEAGAGFESFQLTDFLAVPQSIFYGIGSNLTAPLLNRQAIEAAYFSANNKQIQAIYRYEQTLLKAYTEVVNAANAITNINTIYTYKTEQLAALDEAVGISKLLFQNARVDYLEALFTQRDALEAQLELVEIKKEQLSAYVYLYKALGGGWQYVPRLEHEQQ